MLTMLVAMKVCGTLMARLMRIRFVLTAPLLPAFGFPVFPSPPTQDDWLYVFCKQWSFHFKLLNVCIDPVACLGHVTCAWDCRPSA
jgi:hypothetical protein